ncbi:MoaD/ThiS family protein [Sediminivirga luteola]|jgi:molybdopterin converting factor small subunit|uniref:Molybdopterin synthase sulfur carrier subunit n=1 Tax=Sediminivirga luteola TaxID=1774748 RepID=A0A8J2TVL2_9MICO|nr:MoaD/ThiS family protein [Sediminivirga luteola]GGA03492.1 putative molybdenum cofactor biosynthesis protein D2 (MoaD2) / thiamineS [Sediminivirga luteola]
MENTVRIRYFAAAREAAGRRTEQVAVPPGTSLEALRTILAGRYPGMRELLGSCSFLRDGIVVEPGTPRAAEPLGPGAEVDVLPPFAGG